MPLTSTRHVQKYARSTHTDAASATRTSQIDPANVASKRPISTTQP